jgi:hypothetical protein
MKRTVPVLFFYCLLFMPGYRLMAQALVQTGKSYVNITKGVSGGTIEPGDILEIRATIAVGRITGNPILNISRVHFVDTIPANTNYIAGTLRILTNEGLTFRSYSDGASDDAAMYNAALAPRPTIRINLGSSVNGAMGGVCASTAPGGATGGTIQYNGRPSFYGGTAIMSASYRIRVNPAVVYGTTITMYGGSFGYRNNGLDSVRNMPAYRITLTRNLGLCANSIGANAIIDNGGTFGSGITQNRALSAIVPGYTFAAVAGGMPNDGSYAIVNNLSPTGNTNPNTIKPDYTNPQRRVFRLWDIMGDHTGAAVPAAGNLPAAPGANGGYFVAINASYANSNAIQQTVGGLCPNTYYEFSAWFKNICQYCACDSTGDGPYNIVSGSSATPNTNFNGPDSSGVNPNLTFTIDGVDYYTSGTMLYTGQWVKKGFIYLTGPAQTSFTVTIRNNAAGGGGNDWGIDDITLATCTPNLNMQPSPMVPVCYGNQIDLAAIIRCFFPNYTNYAWERSTDNGNSWMNTGVSGVGSPVLVAGEYEYTAGYPSFLGDSSVHNNIYRIRLASTSTNLANPSCSFLASATVRILVNNCSQVLHGDIQSFSGNVQNSLANLNWSVSGDFSPGTIFEIESSNDNSYFEKVGEVSREQGKSNYQFTDSRPLAAPRYYRLRLTDGQSHKYSKIITLSNGATLFTVRSLVNPFSEEISFELVSPENTDVTISLLDAYGRAMKTVKRTVNTGVNVMQVNSLGKLSSGLYILQIQWKDKVITKRLIKGEKL